MLGKLINGKLEIFSETLIFSDGSCICNPSENILKNNGYKDIIRDIDPIVEPNQYIEEYYEETNENILIHFNLISTDI